MSKKPIILGIESSCDETAAAIIEDNDKGVPKILSNIVSSQFDIHKKFGGVVPELAARAHSEIIDELILMAVKKAKIKFEDLPRNTKYNKNFKDDGGNGYPKNYHVHRVI